MFLFLCILVDLLVILFSCEVQGGWVGDSFPQQQEISINKLVLEMQNTVTKPIRAKNLCQPIKRSLQDTLFLYTVLIGLHYIFHALWKENNSDWLRIASSISCLQLHWPLAGTSKTRILKVKSAVGWKNGFIFSFLHYLNVPIKHLILYSIHFFYF